jgi:hypothetical protein
VALRAVGEETVYEVGVMPQAQSHTTSFTLVSCLSYSVILKIKAVCSYETVVNSEWTMQHYLPQDRTQVDLVIILSA